MQIASLVQSLDNPQQARDWLRSLRIENLERAHGNLQSIVAAGFTLDLLTVICRQLGEILPSLSDPDMALNNLDRFVAGSRNPISLGSLFERDTEALPTLLQIFSNSQYLSDQLVRDPESYDLLRLTEGQPVNRDVLTQEICSEAAATGDDERALIAVLRRYKHRETLRIAYGDIVRRQRIDTVTRQISYLADAICEAAVQAARRKMEAQRGRPLRRDGQPARFVVLALGKLGGEELNYSSDIDLVLLSDGEGATDGERSVSNAEFFDRMARQIVKLLTEQTDLGTAYRVDLRLRPDGNQGASVIGIDNALHYYDVSGRTWERQAFVKARAIAGDLELGREFLSQLEPWIYRRYLNRADITGIKALKRRIEQRAKREGGDARNVKTGHGGIRDIEFVIQFLQLLNGGDLPEIRTGNTLDAIARLEQAGCLTYQERSILEDNYALLRKLEHRLQLMFDLQTHTLPESDDELHKLAIRMGYVNDDGRTALEQFRSDLQSRTDANRKILDHLMHSAFSDQGEIEPEVDLVLDPDPPAASIAEALQRYGFGDVPAAYQNLMALSEEKIPFLSTRRCRHFLAAIAPKLLASIAATPDPDATLVSLSKVSESLGGKGVLWELFSTKPAIADLYVKLCASSPYLSGILTSNPGMIDELMDSLVLDRLPELRSLDETLEELFLGAEDVEPILHSFRNSQHLRVGVRDILGKDDLRATHRALSDIAEACLKHIALREYHRLTEKYGEPTIKGGARDGEPCELMILAMGKLGGREPNYHSDLDVVFLYEADGATQQRQRGRRENSTTNQHFFSQLSQRIIKIVTHLGPYGRLYDLDPRLRPTGKSGSLAVSLAAFSDYFATGQGQLWERQALCKARPVFGSADARRTTMQTVRRAIEEIGWHSEQADKIRQMRYRLEDSASKANLKRGPGGTVDIEFTVQMLQLAHVAKAPEVLVPGTLDAIAALNEAGCLSDDDRSAFDESYRFLRSVESHLRLMNTTARHDLPQSESELRKLAYLLRYERPQQILDECRRFTQQNRKCFERIFATMSK